MDWLPRDIIDALAIALFEWVMLRPAYLSQWVGILEVRAIGKRAN
jgi:hypothetical protein